MANECIDAWKKAKTAFESATNKKKPSEKVLGIFRKGTGIEAACKAVDAATNDMKAKEKATAAFKTAYTSYIALLEKTANDPKEVKAADKSAYISAIISLKLALQAIEKDVCKAPDKSGGSATPKEAPKSTGSLEQQARAHIALREKVLKQATDLAGKMKTVVQTFNDRLAKVQTQVNNAKQAAAKSDLLNHKVAVGVIDGYIEEADGLLAKAQAAVDGFADGSGDFMKARGDLKGVFDAIPDPLGAQLKVARDKPWGPVSQMAADNITQVKTMDTIVQKMHAARAEAVAHGSEGKSVKDYLSDVLTLQAEMKALMKDMHIKSDRVTRTLQEFDGKIAAYSKLPDLKTRKDMILKHCTLVEDQWKRYGPEMTTLRDRLGAMKTRATTLPRGALDDKAVAKAVADTGKTADDSIGELNKQLKDGADLEVKVADARKKNP